MTILQREANEAALGKTFAAYQATRNLMLVLGILATLLATLVAVLVSRRMLTQTRQLETEKQKYQTLFETNSDAVVILDDQGFTDCNPATLSMFGMDSVAEFLKHSISQLGMPVQANGADAYDHAMQAITQARSRGHALMEWQGLRRDGSVFSAEIALHAMQLEGRPVIQAIMRDVSARRAAEAAKEAAREAALQMARAKSQFIANVSHEIRTPMHGILGMSGMLLKTPLDGRQREYAATLKSSAESLLTIINDILDFSKIEAGKLAIEQVAFSPVALVQGAVALFQARAMEKNLHLTLALPPSPPAALLGDPTRIRQILLNLVDNAIKFTDQGTVELRAAFEASSGKVHCLFSVQDSGIGISDSTPGTPVSGFFTGRRLDHAPLRRHRTGTFDQQPTGRVDGRAAHGREHPRPGQPFHPGTGSAGHHPAAGRAAGPDKHSVARPHPGGGRPSGEPEGAGPSTA